MKSTDYRDHNYHNHILPNLAKSQRRTLLAWRDHGPGTTRQVAQRSGIDLLTLRPATTALCKLGLVELDAKAPPVDREGTYRAVSEVLAEEFSTE